jgi:hypothetical protein
MQRCPRRFVLCGTVPGLCPEKLVPPDVIRHRSSMEPGLSSPAAFRHWRGAAVRPTDRIGMGWCGARVKSGAAAWFAKKSGPIGGNRPGSRGQVTRRVGSGPGAEAAPGLRFAFGFEPRGEAFEQSGHLIERCAHHFGAFRPRPCHGRVDVARAERKRGKFVLCVHGILQARGKWKFSFSLCVVRIILSLLKTIILYCIHSFMNNRNK